MRKLTSIPPELWDRIEKYKEHHKMKSDSKAIASLVELGLALECFRNHQLVRLLDKSKIFDNMNDISDLPDKLDFIFFIKAYIDYCSRYRIQVNKKWLDSIYTRISEQTIEMAKRTHWRIGQTLENFEAE